MLLFIPEMFRYLQRIHARRKDKEDGRRRAGFFVRFCELDGSTFDIPWTKLLFDECCDCVGHSIGSQCPEHA